MDQYSRRILAWTLTRRRTTAATSAVLANAVRRRRPASDALIVPSDRGSESMGRAFCAEVTRHGLLQNANVRGPGDSAHAESFFHSLTAALTRGVIFLTERALRTALDAYIRYYNQRRMHSALGYQSPIAFERHAAKNANVHESGARSRAVPRASRVPTRRVFSLAQALASQILEL